MGIHLPTQRPPFQNPSLEISHQKVKKQTSLLRKISSGRQIHLWLNYEQKWQLLTPRVRNLRFSLSFIDPKLPHQGNRLLKMLSTDLSRENKDQKQKGRRGDKFGIHWNSSLKAWGVDKQTKRSQDSHDRHRGVRHLQPSSPRNDKGKDHGVWRVPKRKSLAMILITFLFFVYFFEY